MGFKPHFLFKPATDYLYQKIFFISMPNSLIVLLGPTGVGKTDISILIAEHYKTEIISCDSRQIYKEMNIGTAVPDKNYLSRVKHHLIGSHSIFDYYNVAKYEMDVLAELSNLFEKHKVVLLSGGSMLYIDAVCKGIDDLPDIDTELRERLIERMEKEGIESLRNELKYLDPNYYAEVDLKNPKRILHALEICYMTGKPYSSLRNKEIKKRDFDIIKIGLNRDRKELYDRINKRVDMMFEEGLEEEARKLYAHKGINPLNTVGYREFFDYFDGKITLEEAKEKIKANSRKYARKQLTWFRGDPKIMWFHPDDKEKVFQYLGEKISGKNLSKNR
jgi:tRNA dimethylallyltransferase